MGKKNPFVTTVGFKKEDPDHVYVAELLNTMGRGKTQFIVKAILLYQELQQKGDLPQTTAVAYNYESIKQIVLQIIEEREKQGGKIVGISGKEKPEVVQKKENDLLEEFDEDALSDIMASIAAFQNQ